MSSDHYLTLGVTRAAGEREIARAYRRLARRYHPDVSGSPAATIELFLAVHDAYETLSDPGRRARYDADLRQRERPPASQPPAATAAPPERPRAWRMETADARPAPPPLEPTTATAAVALAIASIALLLVSLVIADIQDQLAGYAWVGGGALLALVGSGVARSLSVRELDRLWRWTATGGRVTLRRSKRALEVQRRIHLSDDITLHARRLVLIGIPIAFLLTHR